MKRFIAVSILALVAVLGCSSTGDLLGPTPESQIVNGANSITAAATLGTVSLRNKLITVDQAKSYRAILDTADKHLNTADRALTECRKRTNSTKDSRPDPCGASVEGDIRLAIDIANGVKRTLEAKGGKS
jgi:hypothetical protein